MDLSKRFRVNTPDVLDETVDGEVLIVNLESGCYYSSTGSGDDVWRMIAGGATPAEAAKALAANYDAPRDIVEAAVTRFVDELLGEQLLVEAAVGSAEPAIMQLKGAGGEFIAPVLQKYTDMQELLVLDPVHDVEPSGWPNALQPGPAGR
jgi:hypothetical protein